MRVSEQLRSAAIYMRQHGFSPHLNTLDADGPHCFIGAITSCGHSSNDDSDAIAFLKEAIWDAREIRLGPLGSDELRREGWNTDDAVAALEICADIAGAEGR